VRFSPLSGTTIEAGAAPSGVGPAATLSVAISVLVPLLPRIERRRDKSYVARRPARKGRDSQKWFLFLYVSYKRTDGC
jgi:hypothetical protein